MAKQVCSECKPLFEAMFNKLSERIEKLEEKNCSLEKRLLVY